MTEILEHKKKVGENEVSIPTSIVERQALLKSSGDIGIH